MQAETWAQKRAVCEIRIIWPATTLDLLEQLQRMNRASFLLASLSGITLLATLLASLFWYKSFGPVTSNIDEGETVKSRRPKEMDKMTIGTSKAYLRKHL